MTPLPQPHEVAGGRQSSYWFKQVSKTLACNTSCLAGKTIQKFGTWEKYVFLVLEQLCSGCPTGKTSLQQRSTEKRPNVQLQEPQVSKVHQRMLKHPIFWKGISRGWEPNHVLAATRSCPSFFCHPIRSTWYIYSLRSFQKLCSVSLIHWFVESLVHYSFSLWFFDSLIHWCIDSLTPWFID